tara:strand:- start:2420 stop:3562 length:1143 start_codon:yes stop_codon:yes gene_type:complete
MEEQEQQKVQIQGVLENLKNKTFNLYFFTLDTKGNPTAGIANIYEHVKLLNELGYNANILHEKNDYKLRADEDGNGIAEWLGEEYANLPHLSIDGQQLNVGPADFIIIPEIFSNIMDQVKGFPCKKVVFSQSYDYLLELLPIGKRWNVDFGFNDVITTSVKQAQYLTNLFPSIKTHVVPVSIPSYFKASDKPKIPVIALHTRNQSDASKIAKAFYLQYPMYKWITFKELRGLPREQFAEELGKSCLAVWVDDMSGFGTFPVEAFECDTCVIGKIPNLIPEWMEDIDQDGNHTIKNNGIWTNTTVNIPELIASYLKVWLEDAVPNELTTGISESKNKYTSEKQKIEIEAVYGNMVSIRIAELNNMISSKTEVETVEPTTIN